MTSCFQSPISRDIPRRHHIAPPVDTTSHYLSTLPRPTCQHHLLPKSGNPCDMHYLSATLPRTISHHTDTTTGTTCHLHYLPLALPRTTSPACQHHLPHSHYLSTPPPATRTTPHHPDTTPRHYLSCHSLHYLGATWRHHLALPVDAPTRPRTTRRDHPRHHRLPRSSSLPALHRLIHRCSPCRSSLAAPARRHYPPCSSSFPRSSSSSSAHRLPPRPRSLPCSSSSFLRSSSSAR